MREEARSDARCATLWSVLHSRQGRVEVNDSDDDSNYRDEIKANNNTKPPTSAPVDLIAGRLFKFTLQAVDELGQACAAGGCQFEPRLDPTFLDYEVKVRRQLRSSVVASGDNGGGGSNSNDNNNSSSSGNNTANIASTKKWPGQELGLKEGDGHVLHLDDNFDGSYDGSARLFLSGSYFLHIALDGLSIQNSPFELLVECAAVAPLQCIAWWGLYSARGGIYEGTRAGASVVRGGVKGAEEGEGGGRGADVVAKAGDGAVFTVSCRDRYDNKW
jgi:hypothetical protein